MAGGLRTAARMASRAMAAMLRPERDAAWAVGLSPLDLFVSAITILELEVGILQRQRRDARQAAVLRAWLTERALPQFAGRILPVDAAVARRCAAPHVPDPRPHLDALIAATAPVRRLTLATRNIADFQDMGRGAGRSVVVSDRVTPPCGA